MTAPWAEWDHVTKLDPDKSLHGEETFAEICESGTDALEIGGTLGVTREKMTRFIEACSKHDIPLYQEPSDPSVVVDSPDVDGYLVPIVLNAGDPFWVTGAHKEWVRMENGLDWEKTTTEAYIVLNPEASVATYTEADTDLRADDVAAYAQVAEKMLGQEIVYVEYSGTFGDEEMVAAAGEALDEATLFYGGGIHDYESARTMATHADVVVVGDLAHDEGVDALVETVEGAKDA